MKYRFDPSFSSALVVDITTPNGTKIRLDGSVEELESAAVTKLIDALDLAAPVEAKSLIGNANTDKRVVSPEAAQVVQEKVAEVDPASRGPKGYRAADAASIARGVDIVLGDPSFRKRAKAMAAAISRYDAMASIEREIEQLVTA